MAGATMATFRVHCRSGMPPSRLILLAACEPAARDYSTPPLYETGFAPPPDVDVATVSYAAAERLVAQVGEPLDPTKPILVASLADINNLDQSSAFGRMIAEQVGSLLSQLGYSVAETKLRNTFAINANGEFILSRDLRNISAAHAAQVALAGTYAPGATAVYVNLKLLRLVDGEVIGSFDYSLPAGPNTRSL